MNTFKALVIRVAEDGSVSRAVKERSPEDLPRGEVTVRVRYSSLNYKDALSASGHRGVTRRYPHTPGIDAAGTVEDSTDSRFRSGESVLVMGYDLGMNTPGGFGEYIRVPADWVMKIPYRIGMKESMIYGTAGFTAAQSLDAVVEHGVAPADGPVLVTGGTGGVGVLASAMLVRAGYSVTAVSGKTALHGFLRDAVGVSEVLGRDALEDTSGRALSPERWAAVIDTVGGNVVSAVLKKVMYRGIVTTCGNVAGAEFTSTVYPFILRGVHLAGIDSAQCPMNNRHRIWSRISHEWKLDSTLLNSLCEECTLESISGHIDRMLRGEHSYRTVLVHREP